MQTGQTIEDQNDQIEEDLEKYITFSDVREDIFEETEKDKDGVMEREERYRDLPAPLGNIRQETRYSLIGKQRGYPRFSHTKYNR